MKEVICPYCGQPAELVSGGTVYPHRPDLYDLLLYRCKPCDAHVNVHKKTGEPMGRLANKELRRAKMAAHRAFDPVWEDGKRTRKQAYSWLAKKMNLPPEKCHIGMFDLAQCDEVIDHCNQEKLDVNSARRRVEQIFRNEGMNVEALKAQPDYCHAFSYLFHEFLPQAPHREWFEVLLEEVDNRVPDFIALVYARSYPQEPFAQKIEERLKTGKEFKELEF